jgi:WD40 repeat protein
LVTGKGDKTLNLGQRHPISYLSLHDNKVLRQFRGSGAEVCDVSMSPIDDSFLSCSRDRTVRLWNLQQAGSLAMLDLPKSGNGYKLDPNGVPLASYDNTGLVFCITAPLDDGAGHVSYNVFLFYSNYPRTVCISKLLFILLTCLVTSLLRCKKLFCWGIFGDQIR